VESEREQVMRELAEQFSPVMEQSLDGVYLWLDEANKTCNQRLADLFGFTVDEWRKAEPYLDNFVVEEDRALYSWNYHNRVAALAFPVLLVVGNDREAPQARLTCLTCSM